MIYKKFPKKDLSFVKSIYEWDTINNGILAPFDGQIVTINETNLGDKLKKSIENNKDIKSKFNQYTHTKVRNLTSPNTPTSFSEGEDHRLINTIGHEGKIRVNYGNYNYATVFFNNDYEMIVKASRTKKGIHNSFSGEKGGGPFRQYPKEFNVTKTICIYFDYNSQESNKINNKRYRKDNPRKDNHLSNFIEWSDEYSLNFSKEFGKGDQSKTFMEFMGQDVFWEWAPQLWQNYIVAEIKNRYKKNECIDLFSLPKVLGNKELKNSLESMIYKL